MRSALARCWVNTRTGSRLIDLPSKPGKKCTHRRLGYQLMKHIDSGDVTIESRAQYLRMPEKVPS